MARCYGLYFGDGDFCVRRNDEAWSENGTVHALRSFLTSLGTVPIFEAVPFLFCAGPGGGNVWCVREDGIGSIVRGIYDGGLAGTFVWRG